MYVRSNTCLQKALVITSSTPLSRSRCFWGSEIPRIQQRFYLPEDYLKQTRDLFVLEDKSRVYIKKVIPATRTEPPGIPLVPSSILEYSAAFNKLAKRSPIDLNPETQPQRDPADSERDKKEKETLEMINRFEKEVFLLLNPEGKAAMLSRFIEENMGKTAQT